MSSACYQHLSTHPVGGVGMRGFKGERLCQSIDEANCLRSFGRDYHDHGTESGDISLRF